MNLHADLTVLLASHLDFLKKLHGREDLAPLAAFMDHAGQIQGLALTSASASDVTLDFAMEHYKTELLRLRHLNEIRASAVFFHGSCSGPEVRLAREIDEADAIVADLEHFTGQSARAVIAYARGESGLWVYDEPQFSEKPPEIFSPEVQ